MVQASDRERLLSSEDFIWTLTPGTGVLVPWKVIQFFEEDLLASVTASSLLGSVSTSMDLDSCSVRCGGKSLNPHL